MKPSKCHLLQKEGHIISENGVATDPEKNKQVAERPTATGAKDLQKFRTGILLQVAAYSR